MCSIGISGCSGGGGCLVGSFLLLVHFCRNLGAWPSRDKLYRVRLAQYLMHVNECPVEDEGNAWSIL